MRTALLGCPQLGGATEYTEWPARKVFVFAVRRTESPCAGDDRYMGHFGYLLLELALAVAALRAGSGFCSFHHLRFLSLWTTVDEPDCNSLVPRSGCVVGLNSSLA